eukprot:CAMPEP_0195525794 /NCGR_PEP_ID=MMETSP0794_2-20130614/26423_1 /TAXON_ID=515487 /ORGANISM="Stephanopyxis turris, Strain CCMP 815" /LENGTH=174 /DNA_ID=CAMNT_0040656333 /DNA_START=251 /DNA_END=775 /DNA_ORIENTATION=+
MSAEVANGAREHLLELFNHQITNEMSASQLYLSASIWCDQRELIGMSAYMRKESEEERGHALQFVDFATKRDLPIFLEALNAQPCAWETPEQLWEDVLEAEKRNTQALYALADIAMDSHDHAVVAFLQPFHMEQIDSEDKLNTIIAKVRDENKTPGLLRQLDTELGLEAAGGGN